MRDIEPDHPRAESLKVRKKLADGFEKGLVTPEGLSAHGRGEAFDYILGEKTTKQARKAIRGGAAEMLLAKNPIFSVNGNVATLVPDEISELAEKADIKIEVNLFHESKERKKKIAKHLKEHGVEEILGVDEEHSSEILEIKSHRRSVDERGIKSADVVVVPLEDGDRTEALVRIGKTVVTVDLNPMSRTAKAANVTIVDNIVRALPLIIKEMETLSDASIEELNRIRSNFDNEENLQSVIGIMQERLKELSER